MAEVSDRELEAVGRLASGMAAVLDGVESAMALTAMQYLVAATLDDYGIPTTLFAGQVDSTRKLLTDMRAAKAVR